MKKFSLFLFLLLLFNCSNNIVNSNTGYLAISIKKGDIQNIEKINRIIRYFEKKSFIKKTHFKNKNEDFIDVRVSKKVLNRYKLKWDDVKSAMITTFGNDFPIQFDQRTYQIIVLKDALEKNKKINNYKSFSNINIKADNEKTIRLKDVALVRLKSKELLYYSQGRSDYYEFVFQYEKKEFETIKKFTDDYFKKKKIPYESRFIKFEN